MIWSIGAALDEKSRVGFNEFLREVLSHNKAFVEKLQLSLKYSEELVAISCPLASRANMFDMFYDDKNYRWI